MTPLEIEILLHYHTRGVDYPTFDPPSQSNALDYFLSNEYLRDAGPAAHVRYRPTDKLHAFCSALCNVPEPVKVWEVGDFTYREQAE